MTIDPKVVWEETIGKTPQTGIVSEYTNEIEKAMKKYAGLCLDEFVTKGYIKTDDFSTYLTIRTKIDKLIHNQL